MFDVTSLSPIAGSLPPVRANAARPAVVATPVAVAAPAIREEPGAGSTGSLIRTASEQLDQFDRVMEKLRAGMGGGALTYGGMPAREQGQIVDRLA